MLTKLTCNPQESWESCRHVVDELGLNTELENEVAIIIMDVEQVLDEWMKRRSMLPPLEESPLRAQDAMMEV